MSEFPRSSANYMADKVTIDEIFHSQYPVPYSTTAVPDCIPENNVTTTPTSPNSSSGKKISIIGCGQVGLAIAYSLINQGISSTLALVDLNEEKLIGEAKDLQQGSAFHHRIIIEASTDYDITNNSHLVIVTAGAAQKKDQSRLELIGVNVKIMKFIIPQVLKYSPHASICIVSNPCDIMTAVAAKIAGPDVAPGRIFGSGTALDSSRFRCLIAKTVGGIDPSSVHAYIIGEHGDSSVAVYSSIRIGGIPLLQHGEKPKKTHLDLHKEVVDSAMDVIRRKGYTNWAIGLATARIAKVVVGDLCAIIPISTCVRGIYNNVEKDVFLSVPCVVGSSGVKKVLQLPLTDDEMLLFEKSAAQVWEVQKDIWDRV